MGSVPPGWKLHSVNDTSDGGQTVNNTDLDGNMYSFEKKNCNKTAVPGVAMQAQVLTRDRNEMASKLTVGDFVVFDKSDD